MVFFSGILIGLVGSLHCVAMCGPLVMAVNYTGKSLGQNLLYHSARVISYVLIGLLMGLLGSSIAWVGVHEWVSVIVGVLVLMVALLPAFKFSKLSIRWEQAILTPMKRRLLKAVNNNKPLTMLSLGFLNGLLPCGVVYVALAASIATADVFNGALLMTGFGFGTWPMLFGVIFGFRFLKGNLASKFKMAIPVFSILIGCLLIMRGLALDIPYVSPVLSSVFGPEITICR